MLTAPNCCITCPLFPYSSLLRSGLDDYIGGNVYMPWVHVFSVCPCLYAMQPCVPCMSLPVCHISICSFCGHVCIPLYHVLWQCVPYLYVSISICHKLINSFCDHVCVPCVHIFLVCSVSMKCFQVLLLCPYFYAIYSCVHFVSTVRVYTPCVSVFLMYPHLYTMCSLCVHFSMPCPRQFTPGALVSQQAAKIPSTHQTSESFLTN